MVGNFALSSNRVRLVARSLDWGIEWVALGSWLVEHRSRVCQQLELPQVDNPGANVLA